LGSVWLRFDIRLPQPLECHVIVTQTQAFPGFVWAITPVMCIGVEYGFPAFTGTFLGNERTPVERASVHSDRPHSLISFGAVLAGPGSARVIMHNNFWRRLLRRGANSVTVLGFRGRGAGLLLLHGGGGADGLTSAPRSLTGALSYGLDVFF